MSVCFVTEDGKTGIARLFCSLAGKSGYGKGYADLFNHNLGDFPYVCFFSKKEKNIKR